MPTIMQPVLLLHSLHVKRRLFPSLQSSLPPSLSLSSESVPHLWALWWCFSAQNGFTSSKTSLLYLYFTTPRGKPCQLGCRTLSRKRERMRRGGGNQVRKREGGRNGRWRKIETQTTANNRRGRKLDWRRSEKRDAGKMVRGRGLSGNPEIVVGNRISLSAKR